VKVGEDAADDVGDQGALLLGEADAAFFDAGFEGGGVGGETVRRR
jgi:hypothetical protein